MLIKQCTGPFSQCDVISKFIWFVNHKVDFRTLRSYAYQAVYWAIFTMWRYFKIHMICESYVRLVRTLTSHAYGLKFFDLFFSPIDFSNLSDTSMWYYWSITLSMWTIPWLFFKYACYGLLIPQSVIIPPVTASRLTIDCQFPRCSRTLFPGIFQTGIMDSSSLKLFAPIKILLFNALFIQISFTHLISHLIYALGISWLIVSVYTCVKYAWLIFLQVLYQNRKLIEINHLAML